MEQRIWQCVSEHKRSLWRYGLWYDKVTVVNDILCTILSECRHIMRAVASPRSAVIRRVPACLRHPIASTKSVSEFCDAMNTRVIPMLRVRKKRNLLRLENPPTSRFMHVLWEILGDMIREEALDDMYIIARIHELGIVPQSAVWYEDALSKIRVLANWEVVCESSEHILYQHPMLPHPDHMLFVRRVEPSEKSSWASVVASPPLVIDRGDEGIIVLSRLVSCPDVDRPRRIEECVVNREEPPRVRGSVFDEVFERAIAIADD